jgi:Zn finger protein HypA/HybF involved in hydrogenase expression
MGHESVFKCNNCAHEFNSREGGGRHYDKYRCVACDNIKEVLVQNANDIGKCYECGGELRNDIRPMCPRCHSRDVEIKEVLVEYR